jgi:hypothetical protein
MRKCLQIFRAIVIPNMIDVMNILIPSQEPAQGLLDYPPMLIYPAASGCARVPRLIDPNIPNVIHDGRLPIVLPVEWPAVLCHPHALTRAVFTASGRGLIEHTPALSACYGFPAASLPCVLAVIAAEGLLI